MIWKPCRLCAVLCLFVVVGRCRIKDEEIKKEASIQVGNITFQVTAIFPEKGESTINTTLEKLMQEEMKNQMDKTTSP